MKHYFKHDSDARNDQKVVGLRKKYGAMGYGIYFMIVEIMRASKNYTLKKDYSLLAFDLKEDVEIIKDIVENFELFSFGNGVFYSKSLKKRMEGLDSIREGLIKGGKNRWKKKEEYEEGKKL